MAREKWDELKVITGAMFLNDMLIEVGDICSAAESLNGLIIEVRHTPTIGQHVVVSDGMCTKTPLYTVRCNTEGLYYLGPDHGYRKKEDTEESCPVLRCLRKWNLSIDKISSGHMINGSIMLRHSDPGAEVPILNGTRFHYYEADAERVEEIDRRFGRITDVLYGCSYAIEISEETELLEGGGVRLFKWLDKIHLDKSVTEEQLNTVVDIINDLMKQNQEQKEAAYGTNKTN